MVFQLVESKQLSARREDTIEDFRSTWPACEAVKAAELQGVPVGRRYLRRLREAALVEGQAIHRRAFQSDSP